MRVTIPKDLCFPNTSWILYDRLVDPGDGTPLKQSDISAITYVIHVESSSTATSSGSLDKTVVIFDRLQTKVDDPRWTGGSDGFNFRWSISNSLAPAAGVTYRYRIKIVCTDASVFYIARDREALNWSGPAA